MFNLNINTVLSVDDNTVLSVYFNPSTRQDAEAVRQEVLFNIDGFLPDSLGDQREVGFGDVVAVSSSEVQR